MSANKPQTAPNIFADAFSELTELEVVNATRNLVDLMQAADLDHDFSESVCCQRLRTWEETINSPISE